MAGESFPVGQAPWEVAQASPHEVSFPVGQAPWEINQGPKYGAGQTALEHFGDGATMGYLPHLQAAAQKVTFPAMNAVGNAYNKITGQPATPNVEPDNYVTARDQNISRLRAESEQHPNLALASEIGGALVGGIATPMPGALVGKGIIGGIVKGAAVGGGYGFAANPGDVQGVVDPYQLSERGSNAGRGALIGGVAGGVTQGLIKGANALRNAPASLTEAANSQGVKASGAMLKDFRALEGQDRVQAIGKFALDKGLVQAGDTFETVGHKAEALQSHAGDRLSEIYNSAKESMSKAGETPADVGFNLVRDRSTIIDKIKKSLGDQEGAGSAVKRVEAYLDELTEKYGDKILDPKKANDIESAVSKKVNFLRNPLTASPEAEQAFSSMRKFVSDRVDNHIEFLADHVKDPGIAEKLAEANRDYGFSKTIANMAKDKANRFLANHRLSLTDTIAGGAGGMAGAVVGSTMGGGHGGSGGAVAGAIGAGLLNHYGKAYGDAALARGLNLASRASAMGPSQFGGLASRVATPGMASAITRAAPIIGTMNQGVDNPPHYSDGGTVRPPPPPPPSIDPEKAKEMQAAMRQAFHFANGGIVPGRPQVPVNSPRNDTVLGKLTPGEVVLPLSVTKSSNPPQRAKEFMASQLNQPLVQPRPMQAPEPQLQQVQPQQPMVPGQPQQPQVPAGGPDKWASDGFHNLKQHVNDSDRNWLEEHKETLMLDPKMKHLLVTSSSFSPGSKPLDDIVQHLKDRLDKVKS